MLWRQGQLAAADFEFLGPALETDAESGCSTAAIANEPATQTQVLLGFVALLGFAVMRRGRHAGS